MRGAEDEKGACVMATIWTTEGYVFYIGDTVTLGERG